MRVPRRSLISSLIAGILLGPAIGARAQLPDPPTTTTTEATTTTTEATESTTTTTEVSETTTTTEAGAPDPGVLSISAPASTELSAGTPISAGALRAPLGTVTVSDTRGAVNGVWTATATTTSFTTGGASAAETIDRGAVSYWSGPVVASAGIGAFTPGQPTEIDAQALDVPRTAFTMSAGVGDNSVSWTPTIVVTIPPAAVAGTYVGTITHSAA